MKTRKKLIAIIAVITTVVAATGAGIGIMASDSDRTTIKEIALAHAGLSEEAVTYMNVHQDWENGRKTYEVKFYADNAEYEYEIDAETGEIIGFELDGQKISPDQLVTSDGTALIGIDAAKEIALTHAGVSAANATFTKAKSDRDDGRYEYEIEFIADSVEYEYDVDAQTGDILHFDREMKKSPSKAPAEKTQSDKGSPNAAAPKAPEASPPEAAVPNVGDESKAPATAPTLISADSAKEIALKHAGFTIDDVTFTKVKTDRDDGRIEYEVDFYQGLMEYEYEINAETGEIIDFERDYND